MTRIIRVFPRRTKATPDDSMAFIGEPGLFTPEVDEIHGKQHSADGRDQRL